MFVNLNLKFTIAFKFSANFNATVIRKIRLAAGSLFIIPEVYASVQLLEKRRQILQLIYQ